MTEEDAELKQLRADRDRYRTLWLRASDERDRAVEDRRELDEKLEAARDSDAAAWSIVVSWRETAEAAEAALAEERRAREDIIRLEVDRLTGRTPKRRGRPPSWQSDAEAAVERKHRAGASVRSIAAELGTSKSWIHRMIVRVRRRQAEVAEHARLTAIAAGTSPAQLAARGAKRAAERRPIEDYDPDRAERGLEYIRNLPHED